MNENLVNSALFNQSFYLWRAVPVSHFIKKWLTAASHFLINPNHATVHWLVSRIAHKGSFIYLIIRRGGGGGTIFLVVILEKWGMESYSTVEAFKNLIY